MQNYDEINDEQNILENEWMLIYLIGCNDYAYQIFKKKLSTSSMEQIKNYYFENADYINKSDDTSFDIEELKDHIGDYYFKEYCY